MKNKRTIDLEYLFPFNGKGPYSEGYREWRDMIRLKEQWLIEDELPKPRHYGSCPFDF